MELKYMENNSNQEHLERYFRDRTHRDLLVQVPIDSARFDSLDGGNEITQQLADIVSNTPNWRSIRADASLGNDKIQEAFFLHKAAVLADSIVEKGVLNPVCVHWHASKGQMRHPSNDKICVLGQLKLVDTVTVHLRDVEFHHTMFPDHNWTNWFEDFEYTTIDTQQQYEDLYAGVDKLDFNTATYGEIWARYPNCWGKHKPLYFCYESVLDQLVDRKECTSVVYIAPFDKYHRVRMAKDDVTLGDLYTVTADGFTMHTKHINQTFEWTQKLKDRHGDKWLQWLN